MAGWVERNRCERTPVLSTLPDIADDGTTTDVSVWSGCDDGAEVRLLTINGGGHVFPGGVRTGRPGADNGVATEDWDVATLWEFVSHFSLAVA
jgi:polyhydroxybutyrate depolymerase